MKIRIVAALLILSLVFFFAPKQTYAFSFSGFFHRIQGVLSESTTGERSDNSEKENKSTSSGTRRLPKTEVAEKENENESSESGETRKTGTRSGNLREDVCEIRKNAAENRRNFSGDRVTRLLAYLDTVLSKVENFYTSRLVPTGKTISNYNALVADTTAKKAAVQSSVVTAQSDITNINCTSGEIKSDFKKFQTDAKGVETALKAYRDSIKNLISAIRSIVGEPDAHSATESGRNASESGGNE